MQTEKAISLQSKTTVSASRIIAKLFLNKAERNRIVLY